MLASLISTNGRMKELEGLDGPELAAMRVEFTDMHDFKLDVALEEALVLNSVERRAREQGRVWWSYEANKGPNWYLEESPSLTGAHIRANLSATFNLAASAQPHATILKRLIRKGVPPHLRAKVWKNVSGAAKKQAASPVGYYASLLEETEGVETDSTRQIDHDLHRTFPSHPKLDTPKGLAALRRVLVAYSFRDSHVGYCQGMNYVAALLLMVMRKEEDAFWMLATLVEEVLYDDCFAEDLFGCHVEQRVLKDLLTKKQPKLAAHLEAIGFEVSLVTTEWFLCVYAKSFPSETTLRVWDVLFNEGAKVLFRVALSLFKMNEAELMNSRHIGEAVNVLVKCASQQYDPDVLLEVAFDKLGTMSMSTILRQRKKQKSAVTAALEMRQKRISAYVDSSKSASSKSKSHSSSSFGPSRTKSLNSGESPQPSTSSDTSPMVPSSMLVVINQDAPPNEAGDDKILKRMRSQKQRFAQSVVEEQCASEASIVRTNSF